MTKMRAMRWGVTLLVLALWALPGAAGAAPYYEGKTLTIIVGYPPGGGYDRVARVLAKHLPKYIPGKPNVIVENMTGADSMIATNYLYNKAAPDGLTIGAFNRGLLFAQLLKSQGVRFDLAKFAWIGSAASEGSIVVIRADLPHKTIDDLLKLKEPLILGNTGPADSGGVFATLVTEALGIKMRMVTYPSSSEAMLAVERKEIEGRGGSYSSIKRFIERGLVRAVVRGRVIEEGMEKLPLDEDLATDPKWKKLLALRSIPDIVGRPYVAPPGTPDEQMKILRDAFAKAIEDPELKADAKKVDMSLNYTNAADTTKILNDFLNTPPEIVTEAAKYIKF